MLDLYLVRHAESSPRPNLPTAEWPLTALGHQQAAALIARFVDIPITAVLSSTYRRAIDTVAPLAASRGVSVLQHRDLREHEVVAGFVANIDAAIAAAWADFDLVQSGGESARQCQQRMRACLVEIADAYDSLDAVTDTDPSPRAVVAASHGNAIGFVLNACAPDFGHADWATMPRPAVFALRWHKHRWEWRPPSAAEG